MRVVLLGVGPVEVDLRLLDPEPLPQRERQRLDVEQRDTFLLGERPHRPRVIPVRRQRVAVDVEPAPLDGGGEHGPGATASGPVDVHPQIVLVGRPGLGVPDGVGDLLVVVRELDEEEIAGPDVGENRVQPSLVDETLGTPAIHRLVGDLHALPQEEGEGHSPPGFGRFGDVLLGSRGITGNVKSAVLPPAQAKRNGGKRRKSDLSTT